MKFVISEDDDNERVIAHSSLDARMESVVVALAVRVLTLAGVLVANSRSRAVIVVEVDSFVRQAGGTIISDVRCPREVSGLHSIGPFRSGQFP